MSGDVTEEWRDFGLCRQMDPDMFFPERRDSAIVVEAKKACSLCTVRMQCLDWHMSRPKEEGIGGGLLWDERLTLLGLTTAQMYDDHDEVLDLREALAQRNAELELEVAA